MFLWEPSVLWHCWLGSRKGIRPVKNLSGGVLAWLSVWNEMQACICLAQLMPLPLTVSCFSKIQIGFTFLVLAHLGSPGKRAVKWVCTDITKKTWMWVMAMLSLFTDKFTRCQRQFWASHVITNSSTPLVAFGWQCMTSYWGSTVIFGVGAWRSG